MSDYIVYRNTNAKDGIRCPVCGANHGPLYTSSGDHTRPVVADEKHVIQSGATLVEPPTYDREEYTVRLADGTFAKAKVKDVKGVPS